MIECWYAQQGDYPPARDQLLRDLAARAPDSLSRSGWRFVHPMSACDSGSAQRLLARLRGQREAVGCSSIRLAAHVVLHMTENSALRSAGG